MKTLVVDEKAKAFSDKELIKGIEEFLYNDEEEFVTSSASLAVITFQALIAAKKTHDTTYQIKDYNGTIVKVGEKGYFIDRKIETESEAFSMIPTLYEVILGFHNNVGGEY